MYRGRVHALRGIDIQVRPGEVFGLLGPNGAGKSTLVKIMMTVIRPTHVQGSLLGAPVGHKPTLRRVGYLPENHRFPRYLSGRQTLEFFGALARVDRRTRKRRAAELLEVVGMTPWSDKKLGSYSKGMLQRIGLGQALVNDPDLVVLDEPTDGVDPVGRRDIRGIIAGIRERGKTVFINSHLLSELEMICDRVAILVQGMVARQGTVRELTESRQYYEIEVASAPPVDGALLNVIRLALPEISLEWSGQVMRVGTTDPVQVQPVLDAMRREGLIVRRMQPFRRSLEDLFMEAVIDPNTGQLLMPGARAGAAPA